MIDATPSPQPSPADGASASTQGPVIIVIEDEPDIRRFLRAALLSSGYRLVEATTGQEGLQAAETRQPDLIILDLGLPDMDGLEVIRQLRAWTAVPIIVLSAKGQETVKVAALDTGASCLRACGYRSAMRIDPRREDPRRSSRQETFRWTSRSGGSGSRERTCT